MHVHVWKQILTVTKQPLALSVYCESSIKPLPPPLQGKKVNKFPLSFKPSLPSPLLFFTDKWRTVSINHDCKTWYGLIQDGRLFNLEVLICLWYSAAWPSTSCTWAFPLCIKVSSLWRSDTIVFAKLNKPPLSNKPHLYYAPSNLSEIKKPPGGLNRGYMVSCLSIKIAKCNLMLQISRPYSV